MASAVARVDLRLGVPIGQRPGHRHRFGRGEGEIEPGHRRAGAGGPAALLGLGSGSVPAPLVVGFAFRIGLETIRHLRGPGQMDAVGLTAQGETGHRVGAHPEQVEEVLFGDRLNPFRSLGHRRGQRDQHRGRHPAGFPTRRSSGSGSTTFRRLRRRSRPTPSGSGTPIPASSVEGRSRLDPVRGTTFVPRLTRDQRPRLTPIPGMAACSPSARFICRI